ncbi:MAG: RpiB/LacA/LacB family sugar-phosphate isomerase [Candidatus Scatomorpha sp.]|jgi:ribose 5-phosphate isomerase B
MKVVIGADKGGFALKEAIAARLAERGIAFQDVGTISLEACIDFVSVAEIAAGVVSRGEADRGILLCGTGMGMAITANKFKGVRAAVVESQYAAEYARKINDANILCMGGFIVGPTMGCEIVDSFIDTAFVQDFPQWRVDFLNEEKLKLSAVENQNFK